MFVVFRWGMEHLKIPKKPDENMNGWWLQIFLDVYFSNGLKPPTILQGTNISPKNGILKMIFLFPRWDMLIPCRVDDETISFLDSMYLAINFFRGRCRFPSTSGVPHERQVLMPSVHVRPMVGMAATWGRRSLSVMFF